MSHITPPYLFDVHTHTQFAAYANDQEATIKSALDGGIWLVNVGTQYETSQDAVLLAEKFAEGVYAAVGLHPSHTSASHLDPQELRDIEKAKKLTEIGEIFDYEKYKALAESKKVVAIGECGLDYYRISDPAAFLKQKEVFQKHMALSRDCKKPLMIHCRNAFADLVPLLKNETLHDIPGVVHFFSGTPEDARKLLDLGFSFSFGGVITFARDYDEQIKYIPLDRILLETDAPYVSPVPYRGKRNEPRYITETAKKIAEIKLLSLEKLAEQTTVNARNMFGI